MAERIHILPEQPKRIETGAIQFGKDWPGLFIRGDNCGWFHLHLSELFEKYKGEMDMEQLIAIKSLLDDLGSPIVK